MITTLHVISGTRVNFLTTKWTVLEGPSIQVPERKQSRENFQRILISPKDLTQTVSINFCMIDVGVPLSLLTTFSFPIWFRDLSFSDSFMCLHFRKFLKVYIPP